MRLGVAQSVMYVRRNKNPQVMSLGVVGGETLEE